MPARTISPDQSPGAGRAASINPPGSGSAGRPIGFAAPGAISAALWLSVNRLSLVPRINPFTGEATTASETSVRRASRSASASICASNATSRAPPVMVPRKADPFMV